MGSEYWPVKIGRGQARQMRFLDAAADLLLGSTCPACHAPGWGLCEACRASMGGAVFLVPDLAVDVPVWAGEPYRLPVSRCLPAFKDSDAWQLGPLLADRLACSLAAARSNVDGGRAVSLVVPVPSWGAKVRERGIDHTSVLARRAARSVGLRVMRPLRRTRRSVDQSELGRAQRLAAQRATMIARPGGGEVIVVDDIATTGATLVEAVRALRAASWTPVACAVVAAVLRDDGA